MPKIVDHEQRRVELAKAVWAVVQRDGVNVASIRAVAAEAGWTYGAIAHYFKSRDDLLLFAYKLALQHELATGHSDDDIGPLEQLIFVLRRALPLDEISTVEFRIWLGFMGRVADNARLAESVRHEHEAYYAKVNAIVEEAQEAGVLDSTLDAADMTETVVTFVNGLGVAAAVDPDTYTPEA
jgi:AcrR family transcriptional regulator